MMDFGGARQQIRALLVFSFLLLARKFYIARVEGFVATRSFVQRRSQRINEAVVDPSIGSSHSVTATTTTTTALAASIAPNSITSSLAKECLDYMASDDSKEACQQWANQLGFDMSAPEVGFYALFSAIRRCAKLGIRDGKPFCLRRHEILQALNVPQQKNAMLFAGFFTFDDLEKAVYDDFLDAARGSTDNRKGWKITNVSTPRGDSFEEARMTFEEVQNALDKGTVIFNAAGAHIPKLAGPTLACTDATSLPCALNMYVTAAGKRTSAPPHTDKQDVVVVQTDGSKFWRVYSPPDAAQKPNAEIYARGKLEDNMPLYALENGEGGAELLIETALDVGDILYVPAAFPHTTATIQTANDEDLKTSVHLTFGFDSHIWELDYLSARRLALRYAGVVDNALGSQDDDNRYVGAVNELPRDIHHDLFEALPMDLFDDNTDSDSPIVDVVANELRRISEAVDASSAALVDASVWKTTALRFQKHGKELLDIHRHMYMAAIDEGRTRAAEEAMLAHLAKDKGRLPMTPERLQRLSLFRVARFYEQIEAVKQSLTEWSLSGTPPVAASTAATVGTTITVALPENWAYTMPVKVGDKVEADLGGAFFPATVTRVMGSSSFEVQFFDGDKESGLDRSMIKLLTPPQAADNKDDDNNDGVDTSKMTPKQLKRWKKQQQQQQK